MQKIVLDISSNSARVAFNCRRPKSSSKSRTNNRKSRNNKPRAEASCTNSSEKSNKNNNKSNTNNRKSSTNILEGQERQGWVFQRSMAQKQSQKQQVVQTTAQRAPNSSNTRQEHHQQKQQKKQLNQQRRQHKHEKKQQKQHKQQEKQHTTRKASIKQQQTMAKTAQNSNKSSTDILEGQTRQGCVFHNSSSKEARMRREGRGKPRKIEAKRCGVEFRWYQQILSQLVEVKAVPINCKIVLDIFEGLTATTSRIRSNTNSTNNPEKVRAKRCGSLRGRGASSRGISVVFEAFFFLDTSKICNLFFFGGLRRGGQINCKIVLVILQKPPGSTRQPESPKHHQNSTEDPQRDKKSENGSGRGEKERNFRRSGGRGVRPEGWGAQNFAFFFFHSPATIFILSSSRGILVFEAPGRSNVHVWSSRAVV